MRRFIAWLWRGSEAELGDALEEYPHQGSLWLLRQSMSYRRSNMLANFWSDLRYAARGLRNNPGFAAAAILAIALGIGINTGIFSILNAAALRGLPVPEANRLVNVHQQMKNSGPRHVEGALSGFSTAEYTAYRDRNETFENLLAFSRDWTVTLGGDSPVS